MKGWVFPGRESLYYDAALSARNIRLGELTNRMIWLNHEALSPGEPKMKGLGELLNAKIDWQKTTGNEFVFSAVVGRGRDRIETETTFHKNRYAP